MTKKFLTYAYYLFVAAIAALGLLLLLSVVPTANVSVKIVESGSMEPSIRTGSIVVIHAQKTYQEGDVVTFFYSAKDEIPTTHRIIAVKQEGGTRQYATKGDANENPDPRAVDAHRVIGKVLFSVPFVGYVLDFARTPIGFALIIGLPGAYIIFDEASKIYAEVRRIRADEQNDNHVQ